MLQIVAATSDKKAASSDSTLVEYSSQHPKVEGSRPAVTTRPGWDKEQNIKTVWKN